MSKKPHSSEEEEAPPPPKKKKRTKKDKSESPPPPPPDDDEPSMSEVERFQRKPFRKPHPTMVSDYMSEATEKTWFDALDRGQQTLFKHLDRTRDDSYEFMRQLAKINIMLCKMYGHHGCFADVEQHHLKTRHKVQMRLTIQQFVTKSRIEFD
jgi:hypothetical protein